MRMVIRMIITTITTIMIIIMITTTRIIIATIMRANFPLPLVGRGRGGGREVMR